MEAPGSPYASSPESAPKRAPRPASPPPPPQERPEADHEDDKEKPTHLRFLVSNTAAGCIIGKGGSTINDFQSQSGARIQLSRSHEFFPGTNDRIIMVSGLFDEVIKAMELVLEKLLAEGEESNEAEARPKFRLVVPNSSCGGIIGKGGATIKSFIEDSHAGIKISPQDNNFVGLHDRLVTITGPLNTQLRAIYLILNKLSEDIHYPPNLSSPFPYAGLGFPSYPAAVPVGYMIPQVPYNNAVNYGPNGYGGGGGGGGGRYQNNKPGTPVRSPAHNEAQESHTIGVADEHIGAVVGRAGKNITEIIQASGARIKISDRGDFMAGTSDRKVTITGSSEAIQAAESMIMQRVAASSERESHHGQASRRLVRRPPRRRCSGYPGAHVVGPESPHPDLHPPRRRLLLLLLQRQARRRLREPQLRGLVLVRSRLGRPPRTRRQPLRLRRQGGGEAPGLRRRRRPPHGGAAAGARPRGPRRPRAAARPPRPRRRRRLRPCRRRDHCVRPLHRHPGRTARRLHPRRHRRRRGSGAPHGDGAGPRGAARRPRPLPALQAPPRRARRDRLRRARLQPHRRRPPHSPRGLLEEGARGGPRRDGLLRGRHRRRPRRRALRRPPRQRPQRPRAAPDLIDAWYSSARPRWLSFGGYNCCSSNFIASTWLMFYNY